MPTILRIDGYRYHFYTNEGNEPPHIHVTGKGGEMKIWLKPIMVANTFNVSPKDQRKILANVRQNKDLLLEAWDEFASRKK